MLECRTETSVVTLDIEDRISNIPEHRGEAAYSDIINQLKELDLTDAGVIRIGNHATACGGFADVWQGVHGRKEVAIKVARASARKPDTLARKVIVFP